MRPIGGNRAERTMLQRTVGAMRYKRASDTRVIRPIQASLGGDTMRMKLCVLALALLPVAAFAQNSPVGRWKTIDDETGKVKSIVQISETGNGTLQGKVVEVLSSDRGPNPVCDKCSGTNKNKPVKGMTILWNLKPDGGGEWSGGTVLDPAKGKTYKSKLEMLEGGKKLGMSGCVAFICRQQVWVRE
jgi:uncharacterized protein (DUF2147 family)